MDKITDLRRREITPNNERLMKQCYADLFAAGAIPKKLYLKVQRKNYTRADVFC